MTDEEFQRIKEAEKDRLRAQKQLRSALEALKRRNKVQSVVRRMSQRASHLLRETEDLARTLATEAGRQAARLEVLIDEETNGEGALREADEALREERAEAVVRRLKVEEGLGDTVAPEDREINDGDRADDRPEKTIGRMGDVRSRDETS